MVGTVGESGAGGIAALYRAFWRFAAGDRRRLVVFVALLLASQGVKLAIPYFTGTAVARMQQSGGADLAGAARDIAAIFLACLAGWALHGPGRVIERLVATGIRQRFADTLYTHLMALPLRWHEAHHSGDTMQRVEKAGLALFGFAQHQFVYLQNAVNLVGPIAALCVLSWATGGAALLGYLVIALVLVTFDARMVRLNRAVNAAERRYSEALVDCLGNIATVLALRLAAATRRLLGERLEAVFVPHRQGAVMNEAKWCAIDLLNNGIRCFLVVLYAWLEWRRHGAIALGSAVMVYQYAQQAGGVVSSMAGNWQDLVRWQTDFAGAAPILAEPPAAARVEAVPENWREIRIAGAALASGEARAARLHGIDLRLRRGARIALVGASGSGKSTLLRLLAGLYSPTSGAVSVDGIVRPGLRHLGAIAMLIPQEPEIFGSTVGQNLTLGLARDGAAIERACAIAEFAPVLARLPRGLATGIAERGVNLSGGEKQRLALARGILAAEGASLLLLDEPTSSLDPMIEAIVYDRLLAAFPEATIVSALHRLHLLPRFDTVVLMADGTVIDAASLDELLRHQPEFRELWETYRREDAASPEAA